MVKQQYSVARLRGTPATPEKLEAWLNQNGANGWIFSHYDATDLGEKLAVFRRPIGEETPPPTDFLSRAVDKLFG